jgi:hypothetical protein
MMKLMGRLGNFSWAGAGLTQRNEKAIRKIKPHSAHFLSIFLLLR